MMYDVVLVRKLMPRSENEFKRYSKIVLLPISPFPGLEVDNIAIDHISVDIDRDTVVCYMEPVTFGGDEVAFDESCENHVLSGWKRI